MNVDSAVGFLLDGNPTVCGGRFEDAILLAERGVNVELVFGPLSGTLTLLTLGAGALDRGSWVNGVSDDVSFGSTDELELSGLKIHKQV